MASGEAAKLPALVTDIVNIDMEGDVPKITISKSNPKTVVWRAPDDGSDWLVIFDGKTPFTRWFYHVPAQSQGASGPAVLDREVKPGEYKYSTYRRGGGVIEDPMVRVDP